MENAIKTIAKCIVDNNLTEAQIIKELEFLVRKAQGNLSTEFVDQLDRNFNTKKRDAKVGNLVIWKGDTYIINDITRNNTMGLIDVKYYLSAMKNDVDDAVLDSLNDVIINN